MDTTTADLSPEQLREAMITRIKEAGYRLSGPVEETLRTVPRHDFVPDASLEDVYASDIVVTKRRTEWAEVLSCLSAPTVVALQLGQLDVAPGHRVLEIGAGAGYNAALLAHLVGPGGHVTTIDVDADIVDHARERLAAAGVRNVDVVLGDGALGYPAGAPYDRIVATVGAYGIPNGWLTQLAPTGRLVVPLRIRGGVSRSIAFERGAQGWRSVDHQMCGFVPLRNGAADDPRRMIALTTDEAVVLRLGQEHTFDPSPLVGVFDLPRTEVWTGLLFGPMQSVGWMYLWLACALDGGLCWMTVKQPAIESGLVDPMFRGGAMTATTPDGGLAYLTWRPTGPADDAGRVMEVGVIGHGPAGGALANRVAEEIRTWRERFQHRDVRFDIPASGSDTSDPAAGRFFLDRPHHPITVTWR